MQFILRLNLPDSPQFTAKKTESKNVVMQNIEEFGRKKYAQATLMLWIVWFTVVFSYYGMFLWLPSVMV